MPYMPQLNGLRAFAVLAVMLSHYLNGIANYIDLSIFGVSLFFVLSGFLITGILLRARRSWETRDTSLGRAMRSFYVRRFLRIFPLFYLVVLGAALVNIPRARDLLLWNLTYLTNVKMFLDSQWAGAFSHFWSLAIEEQFYIIWPCVILLAPRRYLLALVVATIAAGPLTKIVGTLAGAHPLFIRVLPFSCLDMLGSGALLAFAADRGFGTRLQPRQIQRVASWTGVPLLVIALVLRQFLQPDHWLLNAVNDAAIALVSVALVGRAAAGFKGWAGRMLEWKPVVFIGTISYGIYVYHPFVAGVMSRAGSFGIPYASDPLRFLIYVLATIGIASVSWFALERPLNNLKRRFPQPNVSS